MFMPLSKILETYERNFHGEIMAKLISENASHNLDKKPLLSRLLLKNAKTKIKYTIDTNFMLFHLRVKLVFHL
jgi:hypothetical protein